MHHSHKLFGGLEDVDHAVVGCSVVADVWRSVEQWCGVDVRVFSEVGELSSQRLLNLVPVEFCTVWPGVVEGYE